jgi:hypothetical protein
MKKIAVYKIIGFSFAVAIMTAVTGVLSNDNPITIFAPCAGSMVSLLIVTVGVVLHKEGK